MVKRLQQRIQELLCVITAHDHYRPERHYMRGPGPKSAARATSETQGPNAAESLTSVQAVAEHSG